MKIRYKLNNQKKILIISIILIFLIAFGILSYSYIKEDSVSLSATGKAVLEASNSVYNSIAKIIGFAVDETTIESETTEEPEQQTTIEQPAEEQTSEPEAEATEPAEEETITPEENIIEEQEETNETTEPTADETNITIPEAINETIEEANITGINETIANITEETNITIPEAINETIEEANITEINETITNETLMNITAENITALNITTRQYKAVVNRKVKWIKTLKIDKTESGNLTLEIPKQAVNITIRTGEEVQVALNEIGDYEQTIEQADRENIAEGTITGYASYDIEKNRGILTRLINWLKQLTITGKVIQENELQEEITEKQDSKEIDLTNIISQGEEIGVEYYTPAPIDEETNISRVKQVTISGPDELNYTDILAYTTLDNKISINNSDKIKIYWVREETQEQAAEEITPVQEETQEEITEEEITNETQEQTIGIEENQTTEIINETEQPVNDSSEVPDNLTDIENITENKTKGKEEKQTKEKEQQTSPQTSPITAFAVKDKEKKDKDNETEQPVNDSSAEISNLTDIENKRGNIIREEVNFTAYDLDEDGFIDYVEWNVPHLSNQTYEIIYISKAEHLDENYTFVEDVYEQVKALDGNWTLIPDGDYVRVTFEKPLDKTKDITIYARVKDACSASENENNSIADSFIIINGTEVPCSIYQKKKRIDEIRRLLGGS